MLIQQKQNSFFFQSYTVQCSCSRDSISVRGGNGYIHVHKREQHHQKRILTVSQCNVIPNILIQMAPMHFYNDKHDLGNNLATSNHTNVRRPRQY